MRSQVVAEELTARVWKLASKEIYKKFWIRRDPNEEERVKLNELWNKAKKKKTDTEIRKKKTPVQTLMEKDGRKGAELRDGDSSKKKREREKWKKK